jgi:hypothetical protein
MSPQRRARHAARSGECEQYWVTRCSPPYNDSSTALCSGLNEAIILEELFEAAHPSLNAKQKDGLKKVSRMMINIFPISGLRQMRL